MRLSEFETFYAIVWALCDSMGCLENSLKACRQLNHRSSLNIPFSFEFIFLNWLLVLRAFDNEEYFT